MIRLVMNYLCNYNIKMFYYNVIIKPSLTIESHLKQMIHILNLH